MKEKPFANVIDHLKTYANAFMSASAPGSYARELATEYRNAARLLKAANKDNAVDVLWVAAQEKERCDKANARKEKK